jgi:hypothetical protein
MNVRNVDIRLYPSKPAQAPQESDVIVVGDLHGNALKLIYTLITEGVIDLSLEHYDTFSVLYQYYDQHEQKRFSPQNYQTFVDIIQLIKVINFPRVLFLGDELCDRQVSDLLTLLIFEQLDKQKLNFEVMLSNHGLGFLSAYLNDFEFDVLSSSNRLIKSRRCVMRHTHTIADLSRNSQQRSLNHLAAMLHESERVDTKQNTMSDLRERIIEIVKHAYLPRLRILAASIEPLEMSMPMQSPTVNLYSHAVINLDVVAQLAKFFNVPYQDQAPQHLLETINKINATFAKQPEVYLTGLFSDELLDDESINPLVSVTHDRQVNQHGMLTPESGEYHLYHVHGHELKVQNHLYELSLDNMLGRAPRQYIGDYVSLVTHQSSDQELMLYYKFNVENKIKLIRKLIATIDSTYQEKFEREFRHLVNDWKAASLLLAESDMGVNLAYQFMKQCEYFFEWHLVLQDLLVIQGIFKSVVGQRPADSVNGYQQQQSCLNALLIAIRGDQKFDHSYKDYVQHIYSFAEWLGMSLGIDLAFKLNHIEGYQSDSDSNELDDVVDQEEYGNYVSAATVCGVSLFSEQRAVDPALPAAKRRKMSDDSTQQSATIEELTFSPKKG